MKKILGVAVLAFSACGSGMTCEEAFRQTRITIRLKDSTLRQFLDELEIQTGFPIARQCDCGRLQEILDQAGFNMALNDASAWAALKLSSVHISPHCGDWAFALDRAFLECGLPVPAKGKEGWLKRMFTTIMRLRGIP